MDLVQHVRAETIGKDQLPSGYTAEQWKRVLDGVERTLVRNSPALAAKRAKELGDVASLEDSELKELFSISREQEDYDRLTAVCEEMLKRDEPKMIEMFKTSMRVREEVLKEAEAEHIQRALESTGGHRTQTAKLLGISRKVLWEKLRDLEIDAPGGSGSGDE